MTVPTPVGRVRGRAHAAGCRFPGPDRAGRARPRCCRRCAGRPGDADETAVLPRPDAAGRTGRRTRRRSCRRSRRRGRDGRAAARTRTTTRRTGCRRGFFRDERRGGLRRRHGPENERTRELPQVERGPCRGQCQQAPGGPAAPAAASGLGGGDPAGRPAVAGRRAARPARGRGRRRRRGRGRGGGADRASRGRRPRSAASSVAATARRADVRAPDAAQWTRAAMTAPRTRRKGGDP